MCARHGPLQRAHSPPFFGNHRRHVVMPIAPCSGSTPGLGQLLLGSPIQGGVHSAVFFEPGQPFRPLSLHPPQGSPGVPGPRSRPIFHWVQPAKNASSSFLWVVCQFCRIRFSNVFFFEFVYCVAVGPRYSLLGIHRLKFSSPSPATLGVLKECKMGGFLATANGSPGQSNTGVFEQRPERI